MRLSEDRIRVAEYWTHLPSKSILQTKLHSAIDEAQQEIDQRKADITDDPKLPKIQIDILKACKDTWKSTLEIAKETLYKRDRLHKQIKLLLKSELLEYRYPQTPKHPKQKYKTR